MTEFLPFPYFHQPEIIAPLDVEPATARITYGKRPAIRGLRCEHQIPQHHFISRSGNYHSRHGAEICYIKSSLVGNSVFANQPGAVNAESYRQTGNSHIVDNLVVGPLQE